MGKGLARTLFSEHESIEFFGPNHPQYHFAKFTAFSEWYNSYFKDVRAYTLRSTCQSPEALSIRGLRLGVLPINSALFCLDDHDQGKLWIGRRCLDATCTALDKLAPDLQIALLHHPLDWLHDEERGNIKTKLHATVDFVLRGHLHETEAEAVVTPTGGTLHIAAGAAYQTRQYPNRALFVRVDFDAGEVRIFPIRYEDKPQEVWTVDPSLFPDGPGYEGVFPGKWKRDAVSPMPSPLPAPSSVPSSHTYDITLSFAGEDRAQAEALAEALISHGISVFYDRYEKATLWGKDLYTYLSDLYQKQARYCVILLSQHYATKLWTNHERRAAQARAFSEHQEYILPVRLDDTEIPGILPTVGYLRWPPETAQTIADAILAKLGKAPSTSPPSTPEAARPSFIGLPPLAGSDRHTLYDALCAMMRAQFEAVVFRLNLPTAHLSSSDVAQSRRAMEIINLLEQPGAVGLGDLEKVIRRVAPHLLA
jgi:hypothetical protein